MPPMRKVLVNALLESVMSLTPPRDAVDVPHGFVCPGVFEKVSEQCLDGRISRLQNHPSAGGGFADIWEGRLGDKKVAIKTIRVFPGSGEAHKLLKVRSCNPTVDLRVTRTPAAVP
jgi:hypothetical protein